MRRICPRRSGLECKRACGTTSDREKQMTSDAVTWCVPELPPEEHSQIGARQYCQVAREVRYVLKSIDFVEQRDALTGASLERLEPCEAKVSARFLGGVGGLTACAYPVHRHTPHFQVF